MEIVIIGAGLAGLSCGLLLNKKGFDVTIIEKQKAPAHKVCGEYISNEVLPFLRTLGIDVSQLNPSRITDLELTTSGGRRFTAPLHLGGFGLSRYQFDNLLYRKALESGIAIHTSKVNDVTFDGQKFELSLADNSRLKAGVVIGAYGKRSNIDQRFGRRFFYNRSPFMGVKYHIRTDLAPTLIQLHNFDGGYCGVCKIEDDKYNLCYLTANKHLKRYGTLTNMHQEVLFKNQYVKRLFEDADFVSPKPQVINEISFERKTLVENHILFCGDAAGMISPLCGNGMAMAIHSGKILAETVADHLRWDPRCKDRQKLESAYKQRWQSQFAFRLAMGRIIQNLFLKQHTADYSLAAFNTFPALAGMLEKQTHGKPF